MVGFLKLNKNNICIQMHNYVLMPYLTCEHIMCDCHQHDCVIVM